MNANERRQTILSLVDGRGFASVRDMSQLCQVSQMTIRRDLELLEKQKLLRRTFGGATSLRTSLDSASAAPFGVSAPPGGKLIDRADVLIASSVNPKYDDLLVEQIARRRIPLIAESLPIPSALTVVAVDNDLAGRQLGTWAADYARQHWDGRAVLLDLTYHLSNTLARSRGFLAGLRQGLPLAELRLTLDGQSRCETAYQLTRDALAVHADINLIFAINDVTAWGAVQACRDLGLDPRQVLVLPFGLEGDTLKDALQEAGFCRAGLAMFPEVVGPVCVEAAIAAFNGQPLPARLVTPHAVLTSENLTDTYLRQGHGWRLDWKAVCDQLPLNLAQPGCEAPRHVRLPGRVGFIVPFLEHEWYQRLSAEMQAYAGSYQIDFEIVDVEKNLEDELDWRRQEIARAAAGLVQPGDVILVDSGPLANYLAEQLLKIPGLTVITNAVPVFEILREKSEHILMLTGGAYRQSSQVLVGPTAEGALRELRADKLFLTVAGISFDFGLSHTNISEVTIKQAMIRSAREVILLADHTFFGQDSNVQVAPVSAVQRVVTDDALPASIRLDLNKLGIQITLAQI
jgi:DeoR family fructose operon transcriptional repressor